MMTAIAEISTQPLLHTPPQGDARQTPQIVLERLREGNIRFAAGQCAHPHGNAERRTETSEHGQHPFATVIACSDSRVPPELLFDAGIGDLFVVRVAGNVCNVDEVGSIEYGVAQFETPVCVVLGHTQCGAVTAVAQGADLDGPIARLVQPIQDVVARIKSASEPPEGSALVDAAIRANVRRAIDDLLAGSAATRARVESGALQVVGAIYHLDDGTVEWLEAAGG
ncbi:MAG: carbonic anhydrase [Nitrospiraceae bacterium]|nr:carbonic anhydrase [Nitrospiraceae bacterium]